MSWQFAALSAYFLLGIVGVIDKLLLSGPIRSPGALTFYTSMLALLVFALAPFVGISWPGMAQWMIALAAGCAFALGLLLYFRAVKEQEISRVVPGIAGFAPICTLILSVLIFDDAFSAPQLLAFVLLVIGGVLITFEKQSASIVNARHMFMIVCAALAFSGAFVMIKAVFNAQPFWSGFMWMRLGGAIFALFILLHGGARRAIISKTDRIPVAGKTLFFTNQAIASGAFILQNLAFSLGPVALVNALESTRHFFLLFLTAMMTKFYPTLLSERISKGVVAYKVFAIGCIMAGLFLMFSV